MPAPRLLILAELCLLIAACFAAGLAVGLIVRHESPKQDLLAGCDLEDYREPTRHRDTAGPRSPVLEENLERRRCSIALAAAREALRVPRQFDFELQEADLQQFPGIVDSNSPAFWYGDSLSILNSAWAETYLSSGDAVENLADPVLVELPQLDRPGQVWMEAVWVEPATSRLYGWYHFEPEDLECQTAPIIGAAISDDGGLNWRDQGFVLESGYDIDCEYDNGYFTGGTGDFSVLLGPHRRYFYFLFSNYAGPVEVQGVAVARSSVIDRGQPGTVFNFHKDGWTQAGLGGEVTPVFGTDTGWKGPYVDALWGPSLHWNTYLGSYVVLLNRTAGELWEQEGIYISFSQDLVHWTVPQEVVESNDWYPQVLGLGEGETDSLAGQRVRLFVGGVSTYILEFRRPPEG